MLSKRKTIDFMMVTPVPEEIREVVTNVSISAVKDKEEQW